MFRFSAVAVTDGSLLRQNAVLQLLDSEQDDAEPDSDAPFMLLESQEFNRTLLTPSRSNDEPKLQAPSTAVKLLRRSIRF